MNFFRKFSETIGKYCPGVGRRISSDSVLKGEFFWDIFGNYWKILSRCKTTILFRQVLKKWIFSEIFRNYWKILSRCETTNLFRQVLKTWNIFRKFSEIIGKYCLGVRRRISSDRFLKGEFFWDIFGNYWKILSRCKTTILFRQVLKNWIFFGNFQKLSENIVEVRDDESFQTGSKRVNFFFENFRKLLENIVRV